MDKLQRGFLKEFILLIALSALIAGSVYFYFYIHNSHNALSYENTQFNYTLTFPDSWQGYQVRQDGDATYFGFIVPSEIEKFQALFYMAATNEAIYGKNVGSVGTASNDTFLTSKNGYVYHYSKVRDYSAILEERARDVPAIIDSFRLTP